MSYTLIKTLHLLAAIAFVGTLFFQVMIWRKAVSALSPSEQQRASVAIAGRTRHVIHWVALLLYAAGGLLAWHHRAVLASPFASGFGTVLTLKISLALLIVAHYVALILLRRRSLLGENGLHRLNTSLLIHGVLIVICAKVMFVF